jgi:hypothetical protein
MLKPKKRLRKANTPTLDKATIGYWNELKDDIAFQRVINYLEQNLKGKYSDSYPESRSNHIQLERLGANKGWNKVIDLLLNCPISTEEVSVTENQEEEFSKTHTP